MSAPATAAVEGDAEVPEGTSQLQFPSFRRDGLTGIRGQAKNDAEFHLVRVRQLIPVQLDDLRPSGRSSQVVLGNVTQRVSLTDAIHGLTIGIDEEP